MDLLKRGTEEAAEVYGSESEGGPAQYLVDLSRDMRRALRFVLLSLVVVGVVGVGIATKPNNEEIATAARSADSEKCKGDEIELEGGIRVRFEDGQCEATSGIGNIVPLLATEVSEGVCAALQLVCGEGG